MSLEQLTLFLAAPPTGRSPWCLYEPCSRKGMAIRGEPVDHGECVNVPVSCSVCPSRGEISYTRAEAVKKGVLSDD